MISFVQERTNFLANFLHLAAMHAMSTVAVQFDQLCVKQIGKRGRRQRVYKMVLPIHDNERLSVCRSGGALYVTALTLLTYAAAPAFVKRLEWITRTGAGTEVPNCGNMELAQRLDECVAADTLTREVADEWLGFVSNVYSRSNELIRDEIIRSCSLAAMVFMLSATNKGLDTCPIGFNPAGLVTALRLPERYIPVLLLALGRST